MASEPVKLPPQALKQKVRNLAANQDVQSLRDGATLQAFGNRLPVLQAFQEFLEIERRQTRRRIRAMTFTFIGVVLALILVGVALFIGFAGRMNGDVQRLEKALAAARDESGALRGDTQAIQRALDEAKAALSALQERVAQSAPSGNEEKIPDFSALAGALETLQSLQQLDAETTALGQRLATLQKELERIASDRASLMQREEHVETAHAELAQALSSLFSAQDEVEGRLADATAATRDVLNVPLSRRARPNDDKTSEVQSRGAAAPLHVVSILDELSALRFEQQTLVARFDALNGEVQEVARGRELLDRRIAELRAAGSELLRDAQQALARSDASPQQASAESAR
ncbi:MAG: hypothetical protein H3C50_00770 [Kiritimatiellae bacterium]|nr:hypothetical protein [Kiritimatiellia bacterium]MCO5068107.1 hypothetical protein [Kiritimatiellia bacterium]